ncbi:MAG: zinc-dependent metalloprotease, partial [Candidatus Eremiobacteraeota bacterium]|nr:zinc-dependent metalloprotease [Candidatus Eremiobacteraeota bacterium]
MKYSHIFLSALFTLASAGVTSAAPAPASSPAPAAAPAVGVPYEKFTAGATAQRGLFTIWRKDGEVALELAPAQLNKDFVELAIPVKGIGQGLFAGFTDLQNSRIIRFERQDNKVAILMPGVIFTAKSGSPEALANDAGSTSTVVGVAKILSEDAKTGNVVFDAAPFLQDVSNVADLLSDINGGKMTNPMGAYRLDPQSTYFGTTKSFPQNVTIDVSQTFDSANPTFIDTVPDARALAVQMRYTIAVLPEDGSYMPRIADDRVGYFTNAHLNFSGDNTFDKGLNYIVRWNVQPSDPTKAISPAKKPVVYYLSNTIPYRYRDTVRKALLTWNVAFERIGISNAVEVKDQPSDANFDADDIRYNVIRWLSEKDGGFAEAQLLYNPYNGELLKSGVVVDSDLMRYGKFDYPVLVQPQVSDAAPSPRMRSALSAAEYISGERAQLGYGLTALAIMGGTNAYNVPDSFSNAFLASIILHESGHDFGLRHNFIGSEAYTARNLQSKAFTSRYGTTNSVMEYAPMNLWPKGTPQGDYFQTVLGPYDYHVIKWGYARLPGATTPQSELPTLHRWASQWTNPNFKYSSDEDVAWRTGEAVDPRNQQWDLSSDNIAWCKTRMNMVHSMFGRVDQRFPKAQASYDDLRTAFGTLAGQYGSCANIVSRYIGGEYVNRSLRGDPHAKMPLEPIPTSTEARAFKVLEDDIFSAKAWNFSPALLRQMVTQYRYDDWEGNFAPRHDIAIEQLAQAYQNNVISRMFAPVTLQRLDDMSFKYGHTTMDIADLFAWMQSATYGDLNHAHASI